MRCSISWGGCAWIVSSEIFPNRLRSKGVSIATAANWAFNWLLALSTPYLVDELPPSLDLGPRVSFLWSAFILAGDGVRVLRRAGNVRPVP